MLVSDKNIENCLIKTAGYNFNIFYISYKIEVTTFMGDWQWIIE